jgi:hypothetical protein
MVASMSVHLQKPFWKRLNAALDRAGRWTLVSVVLGFALINVPGPRMVRGRLAHRHLRSIGLV